MSDLQWVPAVTAGAWGMSASDASIELRPTHWPAPFVVVVGGAVAVAVEGTADELRQFADRVRNEVSALLGERNEGGDPVARRVSNLLTALDLTTDDDRWTRAAIRAYLTEG